MKFRYAVCVLVPVWVSDVVLQRKDDPAVKERELALQSLDLVYAKYREIMKNLDEGFKYVVTVTSRS